MAQIFLVPTNRNFEEAMRVPVSPHRSVVKRDWLFAALLATRVRRASTRCTAIWAAFTNSASFFSVPVFFFTRVFTFVLLKWKDFTVTFAIIIFFAGFQESWMFLLLRKLLSWLAQGEWRQDYVSGAVACHWTQ